MNVNTLLTLVGFIVTIMGGAMAYASFRAETTAWRAETVAQIAELKAQRAADMSRLDAMATSVNSLTVQDARQMEQIASMLSYLQRIERAVAQLAGESAVIPHNME